MERLRLALVGAGRRGAGAHLPVLTALDDVYELVAVCDRDEATAARYAKELSARAGIVTLTAHRSAADTRGRGHTTVAPAMRRRGR